MKVDLGCPVFLVKGKDETLLRQGVTDLVHELVGEGDRDLMVDELEVGNYVRDDADAEVAPVVDAAQTPPFLADRRVVLARHMGVFGTKDAVAPLVSYLGDPLPTTTLVLVWERDPKPGAKLAAVPKSLADAVKAAGGTQIDTAVAGRGKGRRTFVDEQVSAAGLSLDGDAERLLEEHLGGDLGRVRPLLDSLVATFGAGSRLSAADIEPYLGAGGDLPPWDLTDAIDGGDVTLALDRLSRMLAGGRHPLQVMATLHGHFERMLRLEGAGVGDERAAAEALGMKGSTYPAKKALAQGRRLGPERLHECVELLAGADADLRGARAWPDELVIEVLVARLASRSRSAGRGRR